MATDTAVADAGEMSLGAPILPPLTNGDHLTQAEFFHRYEAMPRLRGAELVERIVYLPSPVSHKYHSAPCFDLIGWLGSYQAYTQGVCGGAKGTLRLDDLNALEPDAYLILLPSYGGQARIDKDGYVTGAPELVAEVAASSVAIDLHGKFAAYLRNGVREYVVWRVFDREIDWFVARDGRFDRLPPGEGGRLESQILPGLWLDPAALIRGDLLTVTQTVQKGSSTPEHAAFVDRLRQRAAQTRP
jgi:Uma2 family endonuclease